MSQSNRKWVRISCSFVYDKAPGSPDHGIEAGTRFQNLPGDWVCPDCRSPKGYFEHQVE